MSLGASKTVFLFHNKSSLRSPHIPPMREIKFTQNKYSFIFASKRDIQTLLKHSNFVKPGKRSKGKETAKLTMKIKEIHDKKKTPSLKPYYIEENPITTQKYRTNRPNKVQPCHYPINYNVYLLEKEHF